MPKRRRLDSAHENKFWRALNVRGASERAAAQIWNICYEDTDHTVARGTQVEIVDAHLSGWQECFEMVQFDCHDGSQISLPILSLQQGLVKVCHEAPAFQKTLQRALQRTGFLHPVLYCDECTAGNVLAVSKGRKANLYYVSWLETWHFLKSPSMWICVCIAQSQCLAAIRGGMSKVMLEVLKRTVNQSLEDGFLLADAVRFRQVQKAYFLGDHDAVRAVFSLKGSAGLRPCCLCDNIVKIGSGLEDFDDYLLTIAAAEGFKPNSDTSIWADVDRLEACETKAELDRFEKSSGLTYDEKSLMCDKDHRWKLPPSRIIYDYMHTYLHNGVASWELALFVQALLSHSGITLRDLQLTAMEDKWQSLKCTKRGASYMKNLLHERMFGDGLYKGQAHHTAALLPLLHYYVETVVRPSNSLPQSYIKSFLTVCEIVSSVRELQHSLKPVSAEDVGRLNQLQRAHHKLFEVYGVEHKPKHHHRMHMPQHWLSCRVVVACDPLESKHMVYKSGVADRQKSHVTDFEKFSNACLPRLLQTSVEIIKETGLPFWELLPPTREADLDDKLFFATTQLTCSKSCLK